MEEKTQATLKTTWSPLAVKSQNWYTQSSQIKLDRPRQHFKIFTWLCICIKCFCLQVSANSTPNGLNNKSYFLSHGIKKYGQAPDKSLFLRLMMSSGPQPSPSVIPSARSCSVCKSASSPAGVSYGQNVGSTRSPASFLSSLQIFLPFITPLKLRYSLWFKCLGINILIEKKIKTHTSNWRWSCLSKASRGGLWETYEAGTHNVQSWRWLFTKFSTFHLKNLSWEPYV